MYIVKLTVAEHSALLSVLLDRSLDPDGTVEWVDVSNGKVTHLQDLLREVACADLDPDVVLTLDHINSKNV